LNVLTAIFIKDIYSLLRWIRTISFVIAVILNWLQRKSGVNNIKI